MWISTVGPRTHPRASRRPSTAGVPRQSDHASALPHGRAALPPAPSPLDLGSPVVPEGVGRRPGAVDIISPRPAHVGPKRPRVHGLAAALVARAMDPQAEEQQNVAGAERAPDLAVGGRVIKTVPTSIGTCSNIFIRS
jgi:hypothetical protein